MKQNDLNKRLTSIGVDFKAARLSMLTSVKAVSEGTGLHRSTVYKIEQGKDAMLSSILIYQDFIRKQIPGWVLTI